MGEVNRELLCKDCVHSEAGWMARLMSTGHYFTCKHPDSWIPDEFDPVTGKTTPARWKSCGSMRVTRCGGEAKFWAPSNPKKHMFLRIQHNR